MQCLIEARSPRLPDFLLLGRESPIQRAAILVPLFRGAPSAATSWQKQFGRIHTAAVRGHEALFYFSTGRKCDAQAANCSAKVLVFLAFLSGWRCAKA
jgi:hypothetical protein